MSEPEPFTPPDPAKIAEYTTIARAVLQLGAGAGIVGGSISAMSDAQLSQLIGDAMIVLSLLSSAAGLLWSFWEKRKLRQASEARAIVSAQASAQATAEAGTPTAIVAPPGVKS